MFILPEHPSLSPVLSVFVVAQSLFSVQCLLYHCLSFCHISFGHCIVCPSSIYSFLLLL